MMKRRILLCLFLGLLLVGSCTKAVDHDTLPDRFKKPELIHEALVSKHTLLSGNDDTAIRTYIESIAYTLDSRTTIDLNDQVIQQYRLEALDELERNAVLSIEPESLIIEFTKRLSVHAAIVYTPDHNKITTLYLINNTWM